MVKLILAGADLYIKDDINERNVLHWACYHGHADLVDILV